MIWPIFIFGLLWRVRERTFFVSFPVNLFADLLIFVFKTHVEQSSECGP